MMTVMEASDMDLLSEYVHAHSEQAFRTLVERHVNMVHAVALRQTALPHLAEDVTQAVFIVLAEKAPGIPPGTILAGWLFRATRFAAANVKRSEARREHWEQKAGQMEPTISTDPDPEQIAPLLNEALEELPELDRAAILLRFFQSKSMQEVGCTLGTTESAAKMRLSRAVEKLRRIFRKRGLVVPASVLLAVLSAQAAHAAPAGLAGSVATLAFVKHTSTATLPIVKGTLLFMAQTKSKTLAITALMLLLSATTAVVVHQSLAQKSIAAEAAKPAMASGTNVLIFRDKPSWNRSPDFEDALAGMGVEPDQKTSDEMSNTDLGSYRYIIIPGNQKKTFYQNYSLATGRFDSYVKNGGTLVLELNGAEDSPIPLPRGVTMMKHGSKENSILVPAHPILTPMGGRVIRADFASHGYLEGVPKDALVLVAESIDGKPDLSRPTFIEYAYGAGRVLAACQCFHDRDKSGRGPLMESTINYAKERQWFGTKK